MKHERHRGVKRGLRQRAQRVAQRVGLRLERPPALNDDPRFVAALAGIVRDRASAWTEARAA